MTNRGSDIFANSAYNKKLQKIAKNCKMDFNRGGVAFLY